MCVCACVCACMCSVNGKVRGGSKSQLSMFHTAGGTSDAHTSPVNIWYNLLQVTSPAPGVFACTDF